MESRGCSSSTNRRCLHVLLLVCFCLLKQHFRYVTAAPEALESVLDNEGLSSDNSPDSKNKLNSLNSLLPLNPELKGKRSSAFFPLRGKKYGQYGDFQMDPWDMSDDGSQEDDKRSQFYPLRGKKVPDDLKRASYFMPMRGRKDDDAWSMEDKRMSSFMPMRGKKSNSLVDSFQHLGKPGTYPSEILYPPSSDSGNGQEEKRGMGFLPSRGKKSLNISDQQTSHTINKRTAFVPMRGRRLTSEEDNFVYPGEITTSLVEKRQYSFLPMRGRRSGPGAKDPLGVENFVDNVDKRAQAFTAMRGKKSSEIGDYDAEWNEAKRKSSFLPMRGKRSVPEDISSAKDVSNKTTSSHYIAKRASSFMPMRGRRLHNGVPFSDDASIEESKRLSFTPMSGSRSLDSIPFGDSFDKKASSFMPMRGRRDRNEDFDISEDPKRASSFMPMRGRRATFMPMRGRRDGNEDYDSSEDPKRASSFMPMRGRRATFMPMRGRRDSTEEYRDLDSSEDPKRASSFMPMRGRRATDSFRNSNSFYNPFPFLMPSGIGSSLMTRYFNGLQAVSPTSSLRSAMIKNRKLDWDSVKRAFHASRGKRNELDSSESGNVDSSESGNLDSPESEGKGCRYKRSLFQSRNLLKPHRQYIALKRPMSFFATRGKRMDSSFQ